MKKFLALLIVLSMLLSLVTLPSYASAGPVQYAPVRNIRTPIAGQYPMSFYRNTLLDYNFGHAASGMTQTISWSPDIDDRGFLPNTAYTAVLELEPVSGNAWTNAGFPNPASFSANSLTWENLGNLPPMAGIDSITSEYFSGQASGNYFAIGGGPNPNRSTASAPDGANMRVFITFKPTASEVSAPEVIFYDDFNGPTKTGTGSGSGVGTGEAYVEGTTTHWARGTQQARQGGSYWSNNYSYLQEDPDNPGNNLLVLGWAQNTSRYTSNSGINNMVKGAPPAAYGVRLNGEGYDTLEILFNVAIYDVYWMGGDYLVDLLHTTAEEWAALASVEKLAAWNSLSDGDKTIIWDGFWPDEYPNENAYNRFGYIDAGVWDTRVGGVAGPFSWAYGYYEVGIRMTPVNGMWTAFWMNGEGTGGSSGGATDSTVTDINRIDSANPVLARPGSEFYDAQYYGKNASSGATLTAAQMLTAAQRQASWHSAEIDVIEDCEQVMESAYSTGLHYGGYSGYGGGLQHQEAWMPYDSNDSMIQQAAELNIFDGEIHRLGYEWSPTDTKMFLDDQLIAQASDNNTHWRYFVAEKDQVRRLPKLDGRLGVPQNPNMLRLSVEAANWSGHGVEYKYYPYTVGLGLITPTSKYYDPEDPYRRLMVGTLENGGAAAIDYVYVLNGPKPDKTIVVSAELSNGALTAQFGIQEKEGFPKEIYTDAVIAEIFKDGEFDQALTGFTYDPETGVAVWTFAPYVAKSFTPWILSGVVTYVDDKLESDAYTNEVESIYIASASATASVKKLSGNKNDLTVTVTELYSDGLTISYTETFSINNNAADTYSVDVYKVYVDTKGNDQIRACEIV